MGWFNLPRRSWWSIHSFEKVKADNERREIFFLFRTNWNVERRVKFCHKELRHVVKTRCVSYPAIFFVGNPPNVNVACCSCNKSDSYYLRTKVPRLVISGVPVRVFSVTNKFGHEKEIIVSYGLKTSRCRFIIKLLTKLHKVFYGTLSINVSPKVR